MKPPVGSQSQNSKINVSAQLSRQRNECLICSVEHRFGPNGNTPKTLPVFRVSLTQNVLVVIKCSLSLLECVFVDVKKAPCSHSKEFALPHQAALIKGPLASFFFFFFFDDFLFFDNRHLISAPTLVRAFDGGKSPNGAAEAPQYCGTPEPRLLTRSACGSG